VQRVSVSNESGTSVLRVTASASTPEAARDLSEAWARALIVEIDSIETNAGAAESPVVIRPGESARLPSSPSSPNVRTGIAAGLLGGIVLGIGYALLRSAFDRRIRSVEQVERETGVPVVGTIPAIRELTDDHRLVPASETASHNLSDDMHAMAEALRTMRSNLQVMDVDNPPRVIVITSPLPGDGKSTTSANLALTLAATGERVILIDGDLRRPMVTKVFNLIDGAGLTDVLTGSVGVEDVAHRINDNLIVVGPGRIPPNPSEILGSERMNNLMNMLAEQAIVIIDAPPLLPVTDAAVLARHADGALVVAKVGTTTSEVLQKALSNLTKVKARALGIVLNRVPLRGAGSVYYGYQYRGKYYREAAPTPASGSDQDSQKTTGDGFRIRSRRRTDTPRSATPYHRSGSTSSRT
jgi:capsular exopolysaccharide synthesis family protein